MTVNQARLRVRVFAFISFMFLGACGEGGPDPEAGAEAGRQPPTGLRFLETEPPAGARIAARVGGTAITFADVRREAAVRELTEDAEALTPADPAFREALDELIDQRLLALEAARRNLQTEPEARRRLAAAEERILGNVLVEQAVSDAVTDETIRRVYEEQSRLAPPAEEIRARHILVDTREEADEVARLLAEGTDFAQLAARVSQDPATRFEGGDLGYFTREGILPAFARVAFSTPVGAVSDPFQTEYGWHVLTVTDRRSQPRPGLEAMRGNIVRFLTLQGIDALLADIRETYPVTITAGAAPEGLRTEEAEEASEPDAAPGADDPEPAPGGGRR
ncbi:MAG: peptidylprolyl isomerase [Oceanicaulis sp.]